MFGVENGDYEGLVSAYASYSYRDDGTYSYYRSYEDIWKEFPASFIMNGGRIEKNKAVKSESGGGDEVGGGIYIASDNAVLNAGTISGNSATSQGGGIYVSSTPYTAHLYNALVTQNTAQVLGGGLWFCPTGDAAISVTNGGAVFGNRSEQAGDDYVSVPQGEDREYMTTLADRLLGGGEVRWYEDGGVLGDSVLGAPDETPRYDPQNPGAGLTDIHDSNRGYALKAVSDENAMRLAQNCDALFITENSAPRGGGIGSNGGIVIGNPGEEYRLEVVKDWGDTPDSDRIDVTIQLRIGNYELDKVVLSRSNGWSAVFAAPDSLENLEITVRETPVPDGFEALYSQAQIDPEKRWITITVSNTPISNPPVVPGEETSEPESSTSVPEANDGVAGPETGDRSAAFVPYVGACGLAIAAAALFIKKDNNPFTLWSSGPSA